MKIQEIHRNGSKYYHVYLPKSVIENVLGWQGKDKLSYRVENNILVLKKEDHHDNEWLDTICCHMCYNTTILIKILKNPLRNQYNLVSRCPDDHNILKTTLPTSHFEAWNSLIIPQIFQCDLCGGSLLEEKRKFVRSNLGFRIRLKLFCRDCGRHRIKVIAQEIWDLTTPPETQPPPFKTPFETSSPRKTIYTHCPTCEEPINPAQSFCSQCGTCLHL